MDAGRLALAGAFQNGRPEQRVKIQDVLADEMVQFGARVRIEEIVEPQLCPCAQLREAREVADRRVEPNIEILPRGVGYLESEVGRVARDVPVLEALRKPFVELVRNVALYGAAIDPGLESRFERAQAEEIMLRLAPNGRRAADDPDR